MHDRRFGSSEPIQLEPYSEINPHIHSLGGLSARGERDSSKPKKPTRRKNPPKHKTHKPTRSKSVKRKTVAELEEKRESFIRNFIGFWCIVWCMGCFYGIYLIDGHIYIV